MNTKPLVLYLDTSIIGGYYDVEFYTETRLLFGAIKRGEFQVILSRLVEEELIEAPRKVRSLTSEFPKSVEWLEISDLAVELANQYILERVVGETSREDCIHIALATISRADVLVSWNFKHIVNVQRIRGYNAVNLKYGYQPIDIRSPKALVNYE